MQNFQDPSFLSNLYGNRDHIPSRGKFLKQYGNRKVSIRDLIIQILCQPQNKRILDIGAGDCSFLQRLCRSFPKNTFAALDIVEHPACKACPNIDYRCYNGEAFPAYEHPFDIVLLMHMLYHVNDHDRFFQAVQKLVATHHEIILTTKSRETFPRIESLFQTILAQHPHIAQHLQVPRQRDEAHFCSENGEALLRKHFAADDYVLQCYHLVTQIIVDVPQAVCDYVFSTPRYALAGQLPADRREEYQQLWLKALSQEKLFIDTFRETLYVLIH